MDSTDQLVSKRRARFRALHDAGCFLIPNPWDIGSARWLRHKGFAALATTSAGFAFTQGLADQHVGMKLMLAHIQAIVEAVPDLPVNADFENAYADAPEDVARHVKICAKTGVAGLSLEDATGREADPLYPETHALERVIAAREALSGSGVLLTARAEGLLVGDAGGLDAACRRIGAFAKAGADVLYAPGVRTLSEMKAVIAAADGKPVNILVYGDFGLSVHDIAQTGARRISVGAALARSAWAGFITAVDKITTEGSFEGFASNAKTNGMEPLFRADYAQRQGMKPASFVGYHAPFP